MYKKFREIGKHERSVEGGRGKPEGKKGNPSPRPAHIDEC